MICAETREFAALFCARPYLYCGLAMAEQTAVSETTTAPSESRTLWRHPNFLKLWTGQTVSMAGSQVTTLALPLTAVLVLHASPFQMGLLQAVQYSPFLVVSLLAGVWIDRRRRRGLLIGSDIARAVLIGSVPLVFALGARWMVYIYVIAFLSGIMTVVFNVAYHAYLPFLVDKDQLADGNSRLEGSRAITQVAGPGLGGLLVQALGPPTAMIADALSFLVSAAALQLIRKPEPEPERRERSVRAELQEGWAFMWSHPLVRPISISCAIVNLAFAIGYSIQILFLNRDLGFTPALLGIALAVGGGGAVVGALTAKRLVKFLKFGPTVTASTVMMGAALVAQAVAGIVPGSPFIIVAAAEAIVSYGVIVYNVSLFTLWQSTTPSRLRGRVGATLHFMIWGALPLGAVIGGSIGTFSLRWALAVGGIGILASAVWVAFSVLGKVLTNQDTEAVAD